MWGRRGSLALLCSLGAASGHYRQHELQRGEEPIVTFDHTVLGNLQDGASLAQLQVPKRHLFVARINVGTPPQEMSCLLDSGTADLWLPSQRCTGCDNLRHFHADNSATFMPAVVHTPDGLMPVPVQISYGTGDIVGFLVQDHVSIAEHRFLNQSFIIVEEEDLPKHRSWDGVCGLGWKQLTDAVTPLYRNTNGDGGSLFALVPGFTGGHRTTFLTVGGVPVESLMMDTLGWATAEPLDASGKRSYWVASGGISVNQRDPIKARLLIDTATAYVLVPARHYRNVLRTLFRQEAFEQHCGVDASAGNLVVCDCAATLDAGALGAARFSVHLGGKDFPIAGTQLFKRVLSTANNFLCLLLVQPAPPATFAVDPMAVLASLLAEARLEQEAAMSGGGAGGQPGATVAGDERSLPPGAILAPFLFPGLLPAQVNGQVGPPGGGEEVEEVEQIMADGSLCTTTLVWEAGVVKSNTTRCKQGLPQQSTRRLQRGSLMSDPMQDVWILGGVFLERFAAIFDYENGQLGLAVSREGPSPPTSRTEMLQQQGASRDASPAYPMAEEEQQQQLQQQQQPVGQQQQPEVKAGGGAPSFPWAGVAFALMLLGGAAGVGNLYRKVKLRKNLNRGPLGEGDMDAPEEDPNELLAE